MTISEYNKKKISISNVIALINFLSQYSNSLYVKKLEEGKSQNIIDLYKAYLEDESSKRDEHNESLDDILNNYATLQHLIDEKSGVENCYPYLLQHYQDKDKIIALLEKIQSLGFRDIYFDESLDFSNEIYEIDTKKYPNELELNYLDNMEGIPSSKDNIIRYSTKNSGYKIIIPARWAMMWAHEPTTDYQTSNAIALNSLTFSPDRLPNSVSDNFIIGEITKLKEEVKDSSEALKNSIKLSNAFDNLMELYQRENKELSELGNMTPEEIAEVKLSLLLIKKGLEELKGFNDSYSASTREKYPIFKKIIK